MEFGKILPVPEVKGKAHCFTLKHSKPSLLVSSTINNGCQWLDGLFFHIILTNWVAGIQNVLVLEAYSFFMAAFDNLEKASDRIAS